MGVCGSDLHQWTADHSWPVNYPVTLGHEFAGVVAQAGAQVRNFREGDRVCSETAAVIDPDSPLSRIGRYNLDPSRRGFGYGVDGAMTRFVRVPARCLHRVPSSLPLRLAALTEPCCVAYGAVVANVTVAPGDRILVWGPAPSVCLCGRRSAAPVPKVGVVGLPRDSDRLKLASQFDCQPLLNDQAAAWAGRDGLGCDGVVDAAGVSATLKVASNWCDPTAGSARLAGAAIGGILARSLVQKNVQLQGSFPIPGRLGSGFFSCWPAAR